jgi:hypothetical protein
MFAPQNGIPTPQKKQKDAHGEVNTMPTPSTSTTTNTHPTFSSSGLSLRTGHVAKRHHFVFSSFVDDLHYSLSPHLRRF